MTREYRKWLPEEDQYVRDNWHQPGLTVAQIGEAIGRAEDAVKARARVGLKLGHRPQYDPWPEGLFDRVAALYLAGEGASDIARKFGLTRNQVTSKLSRRGLIRRAAPSAPNAQKSTAITARARPRAAAKATPARKELGVKVVVLERAPKPPPTPSPSEADRARAFSPLPGSAPRPFLGRPAGRCRWPVGGEGADMLACCEPSDGGPYCAPHRALGTVPTSKPNELVRSLRRWAA